MQLGRAVYQKLLYLLRGGKYGQEEIGSQAYLRIATETFSGILYSLPWHLIFIPVFMLLYCVVLAQWLDSKFLMAWYALVVLSSTIPIGYLYYLYKRDGAAFGYFYAESLLVFAGGLTSFFVGMSSWWFFEPIPGYTVLLLIVLLSLGPAVVAVAFAGSMLLWLSIALGLMTPLISYVFIVWDDPDIISGVAFGGWLMLYLAYTFFIAMKQNIFVKENLYLKYQLEQSLKTRSQYIEIASHDLRQPMHAMGLFADALSPHVAEKGRVAYDKLNTSIDTLRDLFDSLLDLSRLDAKLIRPDYQPIRLRPHIQKLVNEFKAPAEEKGLSVELDCVEVNVVSDVFLLERILRNLLSNAVKFSESGCITISCERHGESVTVSIQDQGSGIPESEQQNIFTEYHQVGQTQKERTRGLGLGLAIVRRIGDLMNVPVWLDSSEGEGACFSFKLPVSASIGTADEHQAQPVWELKDLFIIVIDDDPEVLGGMGKVLDLWGCQVLLASSLQDVLDKLSLDSRVPAIIISDYQLDNSATGIEAIARIREEFNQEIPGLLITGDTASRCANDATSYDLGLMHKPISPASLRSAIYQRIRRSV